MLIIKDAMVLIHLAKGTILETACTHFGTVFIPPTVEKEVLNQDYADSFIISELIQRAVIQVKLVKDKSLIQKANQFNIQRGEAEAVALYWENQANLLATDDDNVRKKQQILQLKIIGTPAILLHLFTMGKIDFHKLKEAIKMIKETAWFSNTIWDKIMMEAEHG